jgi:hypothetical protein
MKSWMNNIDESWNLENLYGLICSYKDIWLFTQVLNQMLKLLFTDLLNKFEYMIEATDFLEFPLNNVLLRIRLFRIFKVNDRLLFD